MRRKTVALGIASALVLGSVFGYAICEAAKECGNEQQPVFCAALFLVSQTTKWFDTDRVEAISTAFIAAFTILLWLSTNKLWAVTKAEGVTNRIAAEAATQAAQVAEDTLVSANRPWLLITEVRQRGRNRDGTDTIGTGYGLDVSIKNVGNSPATCIFINATARESLPTDADLPGIVSQLRRKKESPGITLAPADSEVEDTYCIPHEKDPRDHKDLGYVVCCVFYSFPFRAGTTEGCSYGIYRATRYSVHAGDLKIVLDKLTMRPINKRGDNGAPDDIV